MSMSVCLSVRRRNSKTTRPNFTILRTLPVAVARFSSDGVAICYVLPVFWVMSRFHITTLRRITCVFKRRQNTTSIAAEIRPNFVQQQRPEVLIVSWAPGSKFTVYDCLVTNCSDILDHVELTAIQKYFLAKLVIGRFTNFRYMCERCFLPLSRSAV